MFKHIATRMRTFELVEVSFSFKGDPLIDRLRGSHLSLSPLCVTRKKASRKYWGREVRKRRLLAPRILHGHFFFSRVIVGSHRMD